MIEGQEGPSSVKCTRTVRPTVSVEWTFPTPIELSVASIVLAPAPLPRRIEVSVVDASGVGLHAGHTAVAANVRVACLALSVGALRRIAFSIADVATPRDPFVDVRLYDPAGGRVRVEMRDFWRDATIADAATIFTPLASNKEAATPSQPVADAAAAESNAGTAAQTVAATTAALSRSATDVAASVISQHDASATTRSVVQSGRANLGDIKDTNGAADLTPHDERGTRGTTGTSAEIAAGSISAPGSAKGPARAGSISCFDSPRNNGEGGVPDLATLPISAASVESAPARARAGIIAQAFAAFAFLHPPSDGRVAVGTDPSSPTYLDASQPTQGTSTNSIAPSGAPSIGAPSGARVQTPPRTSREASAFAAAAVTASEVQDQVEPRQAAARTPSPAASPAPAALLAPSDARSGAGPPFGAAAAVDAPAGFVRLDEPRPVRGRCQYCGLDQPELFDPTVLRRHHVEACPFLTTCPMCAAAVPVPDIHPHMALDCTFRARVRACPRCHRVFRNGKAWERHVRTASCPRHAGGFISVCPLCDTQLADGGLAQWQAHLCHMAPYCLGNPRPAPPVLHT